MKNLKRWAAVAALVAASGTPQAALVDRGGGMIYDSTLNLTWLADMNVNGRMNWADASAWASIDCTGGELSHLFVSDLGNKGRESVFDYRGDTAEQIANLALFSNLEFSGYWSGTEYASIPGTAWVFLTYDGYQDGVGKH